MLARGGVAKLLASSPKPQMSLKSSDGSLGDSGMTRGKQNSDKSTELKAAPMPANIAISKPAEAILRGSLA